MKQLPTLIIFVPMLLGLAWVQPSLKWTPAFGFSLLPLVPLLVSDEKRRNAAVGVMAHLAAAFVGFVGGVKVGLFVAPPVSGGHPVMATGQVFLAGPIGVVAVVGLVRLAARGLVRQRGLEAKLCVTTSLVLMAIAVLDHVLNVI